MKRKTRPKLTNAARGQTCQIRLPGCTHNNEQTVPCHLGGGGMGTKQDDMFIAFGCYNCHQIVDGHQKCDMSRMEIQNAFYEAIFRTQKILLDKGLINF